MTSSGTLLVCPFCGDYDFDVIGLKTHFVGGFCPAYNATSARPVRFQEVLSSLTEAPQPILYVQTAKGEFVQLPDEREWRETSASGTRYNCDCLNADPKTGAPSDAEDAIYCQRWVYLTEPSSLTDALRAQIEVWHKRANMPAALLGTDYNNGRHAAYEMCADELAALLARDVTPAQSCVGCGFVGPLIGYTFEKKPGPFCGNCWTALHGMFKWLDADEASRDVTPETTPKATRPSFRARATLEHIYVLLTGAQVRETSRERQHDLAEARSACEEAFKGAADLDGYADSALRALTPREGSPPKIGEEMGLSENLLIVPHRYTAENAAWIDSHNQITRSKAATPASADAPEGVVCKEPKA